MKAEIDLSYMEGDETDPETVRETLESALRHTEYIVASVEDVELDTDG